MVVSSVLTNHPAAYRAVTLWLPRMWASVLLKEGELCHRFVRTDKDYCGLPDRIGLALGGNECRAPIARDRRGWIPWIF